MKKILTLLLCVSSFGFFAKAQITTSDLQGVWTLTTLEGGDTTQVWTPEEMLANGSRYIYDFPLTTTILDISGTDCVLTYYSGGSRSLIGTITLSDPNLSLNGQLENCTECGPKSLYYIIRSVTSSELVLDLYDEDWATSTYAHFTFTK